ncbi:TRAP transporter substrate-binding protein [Aquisalimonas lutea]|uniref:TRAP transporter substrate-binding protein n=1 Tax=Aquisalimonas lutea TaxID=1327750 RepID=UPI0025B32DF8|nr:TRAP transporter substrate-binding protein [Aquisalimonas lutea]MDN3518222.1 TRAP transporter substrate-binding protein [Aquisalimonas lutea]
MRKWITSVAFALAGTAMLGSQAHAEARTTLTVSSWSSPQHGVNTIVWPTYRKWIEEATDGRVTLEVVYDLAAPPAQMDAVYDGIADITWIFHGLTPGRFTMTKLPEFPYFESVPSEVAAAAYWRTHQEHLDQVGEHRGLKLLGLGMHGPGLIYTREPADSLDDLQDMRIRVGGGVMGDIIDGLGIRGVNLPPTEVYEAASQGVIDGILLNPEALRSFRVAEVAPHVLRVPGGMYRGSFSLIMNRSTWESLSPEDQEAIESVSGERLSRLFGYMMDIEDERGYEFGEEHDVTITEAPEEFVQAVRDVSADLEAEWQEQAEAEGVDGEAAMAMYERLINRLETDSGIHEATITP